MPKIIAPAQLPALTQGAQAVQTGATLLQGAAAPQQAAAPDTLTQILEIVGKVDSVLGKFQQLSGTFESIASRKGIISRDDTAQNNPVLSEKLEVRDKGAGASLSPKSSNEVVTPQQSPQSPRLSILEELYTEGNVNKVNDYLEAYFSALLDKTDTIPDKWKNKTLAELKQEYESSNPMVKTLIRSYFVGELKDLIEGADKIRTEKK